MFLNHAYRASITRALATAADTSRSRVDRLVTAVSVSIQFDLWPPRRRLALAVMAAHGDPPQVQHRGASRDSAASSIDVSHLDSNSSSESDGDPR